MSRSPDVTLEVGQQSLTVIRGDLYLPRIGAWTAWLHDAEGDKAPVEGGKCTLNWLGSAIKGYVVSSVLVEGHIRCCIAGGSGGLAKDLLAKAYDGDVPVRQVLGDLLGEVGESLHSYSTDLGITLSAWARLKGRAGDALETLALSLGKSWRIASDGAIWWGSENWIPADAEGEELEGGDPHLGIHYYAPSSLDVVPGRRYLGRRVGAVRYTAAPDAARATIWTMPDDSAEDPLRGAMASLIKQETRFIDYLAMYPAQAILQHGGSGGPVDVIPDSDRLPPMSRVPLMGPVPGGKLTLPAAGARVLVGFLGGNPRMPYAGLWEMGGGTLAVARVEDEVMCGLLKFLTVGVGFLTGTYTPVGGAPFPFTLGVDIDIRGKISTGSPHLSLLAGNSP